MACRRAQWGTLPSSHMRSTASPSLTQWMCVACQAGEHPADRHGSAVQRVHRSCRAWHSRLSCWPLGSVNCHGSSAGGLRQHLPLLRWQACMLEAAGISATPAQLSRLQQDVHCPAGSLMPAQGPSSTRRWPLASTWSAATSARQALHLTSMYPSAMPASDCAGPVNPAFLEQVS